ncbi:rhomboid domain-containing protein 2 [Nothobranchius furzeri]|uniref:Rhomboid domain containing 2 n=1 Tax=Nothobranchius furzeri TaxID=105023 RepID=A0A8C6P0Z7_NOTFU|nr:rhomboid domain containing 2 [Nothobranchius furzeri]
MFFKAFKNVAPVPTSGILTVGLGSCVLFCLQTFLNLTQGVFSIGVVVFQSGHLHRLLLFPFYHQTLSQLLLNIAALLFLCGSVEKSVGTVHFLFLFPLLSSTTGAFYSFLDLLQDENTRTPTEGLLPVTLACVAMTTMHTKMTRGFLCGVSFPSVALPWLILVFCTVLIPRSVMLCNAIGILIGWVYGKGWFSPMNMSEARAAVLEKMMPFRFLRRISGVMFVPASMEERRKTVLPQINPTPGSYPVQAYAPLSSTNTANTATYEGWPQMTDTPPGAKPSLNLHEQLPAARGVGHNHGHLLGQIFGHNCTHNHSHGQKQ